MCASMIGRGWRRSCASEEILQREPWPLPVEVVQLGRAAVVPEVLVVAELPG